MELHFSGNCKWSKEFATRKKQIPINGRGIDATIDVKRWTNVRPGLRSIQI